MSHKFRIDCRKRIYDMNGNRYSETRSAENLADATLQLDLFRYFDLENIRKKRRFVEACTSGVAISSLAAIQYTPIFHCDDVMLMQDVVALIEAKGEPTHKIHLTLNIGKNSISRDIFACEDEVDVICEEIVDGIYSDDTNRFVEVAGILVRPGAIDSYQLTSGRIASADDYRMSEDLTLRKLIANDDEDHAYEHTVMAFNGNTYFIDYGLEKIEVPEDLTKMYQICPNTIGDEAYHMRGTDHIVAKVFTKTGYYYDFFPDAIRIIKTYNEIGDCE